jgi:hypothetical protein
MYYRWLLHILDSNNCKNDQSKYVGLFILACSLNVVRIVLTCSFKHIIVFGTIACPAPQCGWFYPQFVETVNLADYYLKSGQIFLLEEKKEIIWNEKYTKNL